MAYNYALPGPPFNFLGHFSNTQKLAFEEWVNARTGYFSDIQTFYQVRAEQMRKTAGLLEKFYATENDQMMVPTFQKEAWQAGPQGHFGYPFRNDLLPAITMGKIKESLRPQLQRDDEGMFFMNHLRTLIERAEDDAQFASTASANVKQWLSDIDGMFSKKEYQAVLVQDTTDTYLGEQRYRTHQLNPPTAWEQAVASHGATSSS